MRNTQKLLKLCNQRNALIVPGAPNAFFARIIEDLGFEAIYVTGAGIANMQLGMPDLGLTTVSEISNTVANVADVVDLPIICLLYTSPSPRDVEESRMPSSA